MKAFLLPTLVLLSIFSGSNSSLFGQFVSGCDELFPNGQGGLACTICNFQTITGSTAGFTASAENGWCGTIENDQYIGFVVGATGSVSFEFSTGNCTNGNGLQIGIYDTFNQPVGDCLGQVLPGDTQQFAGDGLVPGDAYYLRIDGFAGDNCDFEIRVISGLVNEPAPPISEIFGPRDICLNTDFTYSISATPNSIAYQWSITPGVNIQDFTISDPEALTGFGTTNLSFDLNFSGATSTLSPGMCDTVNLSVLPLNPCFQQDTATSITVNVCVPLNQDTLFFSGSYPYCDSSGYVFPQNGMTYTEGTYYFLNTDNNQQVNCEELIALEVTVLGTPLQGQVDGARFVCDQDGELTANITGGVLPYTYQWSNGNTTQVNSNLDTGFYNLLVTDDVGCSIYFFTYLYEKEEYRLPLLINGADCDGENGSASIDSSIASGINIAWSTGSTDQSISGLSSGRYQVTLSNLTNSCSVDEIFEIRVDESCYSTISGYVVGDTLINCGSIANSFPLHQFLVSCSNGNSVFTDQNGYYEFRVDTGTFEITIQNPNPAIYTQECTFSYSIAVPDFEELYPDNNFHFKGDKVTNARIYLTKTPPNTARYNRVHIYACNDNFDPLTTLVYFNYPEGQEISSIVPAPFTVDTANTIISWTISDLEPGECERFTVTLEKFAPNRLGDTIRYTAYTDSLTTGLDLFPADNIYFCETTVIGSYDPNDKAVMPEGVGAEGRVTPDETEFQYTIRFQNTGTAEAVYVRLEDIISPVFDVSTMRILGSSHEFTADINDGNLLTVWYDDINLPSEGQDTLGSQGYFSYTIQLKDDLPLGTRIENTADIYFDFNDPIITNTTVNTIARSVGTKDAYSQHDLQIFPNPTSGSIAIQLKNTSRSISAINLIGTDGRVLSNLINANASTDYSLNLQEAHLAFGLYALNVVLDNGEVVTRWFVYQQ